MENSFGTFSINLSNSIMARFGRIELFPDKLIISDPSINTLQDASGPNRTIELKEITSIRLKTWLFLNAKIDIEYSTETGQKTENFASGDMWSTNMFKTIYLYQVILNLKKNGTCDTSMLKKTLWEDKIPVLFMFIGCAVGAVLLTALFGYIGKEFSIVYMFVGSAMFGLPTCYYYLIKVKKLIKNLENSLT